MIKIRHYYDPELKRTTDGRYACDIYEEVKGHVLKLKTFIHEDWSSLLKGVHNEIEDLNVEKPYLSLYGYMKWIRDYKISKKCLIG